MFNPSDIFPGPGEAATLAMARQFGLTVEQTQRALEALMPALTMGLQRGAGLDPTGFARMFMAPETARSAIPLGLDALGQMFGSAQLMQAVLQQASAASGVGSQVLRQMLPMMAGAVVASIVHVMLNQPQGEPARAEAPSPAAAFPFAPVWTEMARAFLPAEPPRPPEPKPDPAGGDVFQQMLRTGAEVQSQNIRAMQGLFETFWPPQTPSGSTARAPEPPPAPSGPPRPRRPRPGGTG